MRYWMPLFAILSLAGCANETPEQAAFRRNLGAAMQGAGQDMTQRPVRADFPAQQPPASLNCTSARNVFGGYNTNCQ
jgi:hypothetical protein